MGASRLFEMTCQEVTKSYQDLLCRVEALGCIRSGNYKIQCKVLSRNFHADSTVHQKLYIVRSSIQEESAFSLILNSKKSTKTRKIETNYPDDYFLIECGTEIALIIEKLGLYIRKQECCFEGAEYLFGDFVLRVGILKGRNNYPKRLVIEVEFVASSLIGCLDEVIQEFVSLFGEKDNFVPIFDDFRSFSFLSEFGKISSEKYRTFQYVLAVNKSNS